jgi:hypothetical protein
MTAPPETAKRYASDRWNRLDTILKGFDNYVTLRRGRGDSWHTIAASIARDTARTPGVIPPTVSTLTRWYPADTEHAA